MPRKLIVSGLALIAAASVVGGATYAKFTDTEISPAQSIKAGTLDIAFADTTFANSAVGFPVNITNAKPGDSGASQMLHIVNSGSLPASVAVKIEKTADAENGCNEPELVAEAACTADRRARLQHDAGHQRLLGVESVLAGLTVGQSALVRDMTGTEYDSIVTLAPGADKWLAVSWGVNDDAGNNIQSDSVGFKVVFEAAQV